ncbi:MAG: 4Fe-4S binding protein [Holosporaceae bacterium]|nr:4Fe-4S binding protein [Holosporaceae bacterium]
MPSEITVIWWRKYPKYRQNSGGREVKVIPEKCRGCRSCIAVCPTGAISMDEAVAVINDDLCVNCGCCAAACPVKAIEFGE